MRGSLKPKKKPEIWIPPPHLNELDIPSLEHIYRELKDRLKAIEDTKKQMVTMTSIVVFAVITIAAILAQQDMSQFNFDLNNINKEEAQRLGWFLLAILMSIVCFILSPVMLVIETGDLASKHPGREHIEGLIQEGSTYPLQNQLKAVLINQINYYAITVEKSTNSLIDRIWFYNVIVVCLIISIAALNLFIYTT